MLLGGSHNVATPSRTHREGDRRATQRFFLRGEIDIATAPELRSELENLVATSDDDLVLDCTDLTFIDSAGVAVILGTQRALETKGNQLRVANADTTVARVLDVLGLSELLHVNEPTTTHPAPDSNA